MRLCPRWLFHALLLLPASLKATADDTKFDLRELCRKRVAGHYLSTLDELNHARGLIKASEKRLQSISSRITTKQGSMIKLKEHVRTKSFDSMQFRRYHNSKREVESLIFARTQEQRIFQQNKVRARDKKLFLKTLTEKIKKVFTIKVGKKKTPGYNIEISYLHVCKRFRLNCSLPKTQRLALVDIFPTRVPKECAGYIAKMTPSKTQGK